jgi:hypothetical protein
VLRLFLTVLSLGFALASAEVRDGGIPLVRQTAYQPRGMNLGLAAGALRPGGNRCHVLGQWQGTGEFFYWKNMSAGASIRFYGGNVDKDYALMYQRYHLYARWHFPWGSRFDFYLSPVVGFETTNLSKIREEETDEADGTAEENEKNLCKDEYSLNGFSAGIEAGTGVRVSEDWGVYGSARIDYNMSNVGQVSLIPGIAFNLRNYSDFLKNSFLGSWISLEFQFYHYLDSAGDDWGESGFLGLNFNI